MAGRSTQDSIGVGPALEKARRIRGLTLEEAARDTKLRVDQLTALELEDFDALPGDAFVRGALRTYAQYLGLDPDKVTAIYDHHADEPQAPPPPGKMGRVEQAIAATRIRDNHRLLLFAAVFVVVVLLIFGLVSRDHSSPPQATISAPAPTLSASSAPASTIEAVLVALRPVAVSVEVDGAVEDHPMAEGETLSFSALDSLKLTVADGGAAQITVNGRDLGAPGEPGQPWSDTFTFDVNEGSGEPSPTASP
jgi:cytoskeletal protein RodZ